MAKFSGKFSRVNPTAPVKTRGATLTHEGARAAARAYLRNELKIRSASIMLAAEYVAAGGESGRRVVDSVLQRGDEPAEMVGYWHKPLRAQAQDGG